MAAKGVSGLHKNGWPADQVERRPLASLIPYACNSRTHSPQQVGQIAAAIQEWGWTMPVLVGEEGGIIAGHGRVLAAQKLGLTEVPCVTATGWSDAKRRAYVIADNKLALNAEWDDDMLRLELSDLRDGGFDLGLAGFAPVELDALFGEQEPPPPSPDDGSGYQEQYGVIVVCSNAQEQEAVFTRLQSEGLSVKVVTT